MAVKAIHSMRLEGNAVFHASQTGIARCIAFPYSQVYIGNCWAVRLTMEPVQKIYIVALKSR